MRTLSPSSEVNPFQHTLICTEKRAVVLQSDVLPWQYEGCCLILPLAAAVPRGEAHVQVTATTPSGVLLNLWWGCAGPAHRASSLLPSAAVAAGASSP